MFISLKTLLGKSLKQPNCWKTKLLTQWPTIVGNLNSRMTLEKVFDDTLIIGVYETSWLQELYMLSAVIIKTVNNHLETPRIKKIRFKHAEKKQPVIKKNVKQKEVAPRKKVILNSFEKKALSNIQDDDMRTALHAFLSRCKERTS